MPLPKLSTVLNNCGLHALTPEIKNEVIKFGSDATYNNKHNAGYNHLKNQFALFYGFLPQNFTWRNFSDILQRYNSLDTQFVLGPVLRSFMVASMANNELVAATALADNLTQEQYIANLTQVKPTTARYESLAPDEVWAHVAQHLGLNVHYFPQIGSSQAFTATNPITTIEIHHQGGIEGAQSGGHWERTPNSSKRIHPENHVNSQLNSFLPLLGQDAALNPYGFALLKKHIYLSAQSIMGNVDLNAHFTTLNKTATQISFYLFNISLVPKAMAIQLLGNGVTKDAQKFIQNYPFIEVPPNQIYERWIKANPSNKPKLEGQEQQLITRLTAELQNQKAEQDRALQERQAKEQQAKALQAQQQAKALREQQAKALQEQQQAKALQEQQAKALQEQQAKEEQAKAVQEQKITISVSKIDTALNDMENKICELDGINSEAGLNQAIQLLSELRTYQHEYELDLINPLLSKEQADMNFKMKFIPAIQHTQHNLKDDLCWGDYLVNLLKNLLNAIIKVFSNNPNALFTPARPALIAVTEAAEEELKQGIQL